MSNNKKIMFLTEIKKEDGMYAGHIFAFNFEEAVALAKQLGETVVGHIPPNCKDCIKEVELSKSI